MTVRSPCGGVRIRISATELVLRPSGVAYVEGERALLAADLHLEKGSAYAARGQLLPPYDTAETLGRLEREVEALQPRLVALLGDTLHDRKAHRRLAPEAVSRLSALARGRTLLWITGNHDPDGPQGLDGDQAAEATLGALTLRHEPQAGGRRGEVAGHLHPAARVLGTGRTVRRRCFATDGTRLVLPAFGAYAGGLNVLDRAFAGLFSGPLTAAALGRAKVHPIAAARLAPD